MTLQSEPKSNTFLFNFLAGGISATISETLLAPLERVKILLQLQNMSNRVAPENQYKGIIDALRRVPKEQGFFSFWRGNLTNIARYFPTQALNFASKDFYRDMLGINSANQKVDGSLFVKNLAAGGAAGATSSFFVYPLDLARTRLAADVGRNKADRQFSGFANCMSKVYQKNGISGFYHGFSVSVIGIIVYRAAYFGGYDSAKSFFGTTKETPFFHQWLLAQSVTSFSGLIAYPLDTVRRSMMMQSGEEKARYAGSIDCWKDINRRGGFRGFYKGALANLVKGSAGALVLVMYDAFHAILL